MIHSITVTNPSGDTLKLELSRPELTGLAIEKIDGLGPAPATINTVDLGSSDGSVFSSARIPSRNIVLTLALLGTLEDPSIESSRLLTYKFFPLKKKIELLIETDKRKVWTNGYVESNEPNIFSSREVTQISIVCPDPNFYAVGGEAFGFYGIQPLFSFPFENKSTTTNLIEMGYFQLDARSILNYIGDVDTGFVITMHSLGDVKDITLYNTMTREFMAISTDQIARITGKTFSKGDDIIISTIRGDKYVRLLRNGLYTNIISALDKNSHWLTLTSGDNFFSFETAEGTGQLEVTFTYRNAYGGI